MYLKLCSYVVVDTPFSSLRKKVHLREPVASPALEAPADKGGKLETTLSFLCFSADTIPATCAHF